LTYLYGYFFITPNSLININAQEKLHMDLGVLTNSGM
jgi:hypothetical protein